MSMLDLFRHRKACSESPQLYRAASCTTMSSAWEDRGTETKSLKRCATTHSARSGTKRGWGIVPVLNELERRCSASSIPLKRSASAKQLLCLNCRQLYFPGDSSDAAWAEQFCSLDCKSSHECKSLTQELVDLQLDESLKSSDEGTVVTLADDAAFSF